jgi:hypothetical protein
LHSPAFLIGQPKGDGEAHPGLTPSVELLSELELLLSLDSVPDSVSNSDSSFLLLSNPPPPQLPLNIVSILDKKERTFRNPKTQLLVRTTKNISSLASYYNYMGL